jgi:hypothetical protein
MTDTDPATDGEPLAERLRLLEREVHRLRDAVDTYRAALSDEVRTRRLVVVDRGGFERIVAEGGVDHAHLSVRARATGPGSTKVELFADDPLDGDPTHVGVALGRGGDVVASFEVASRGEPLLWLDDE